MLSHEILQCAIQCVTVDVRINFVVKNKFRNALIGCVRVNVTHDTVITLLLSGVSTHLAI